MCDKALVVNRLFKTEIYKKSCKLKTQIHCKFIIIKDDAKLVLVFGPLNDFPYHAYLAKSYCDLFEIPSSWGNKPDSYHILKENCRVSGGGWFKIDPVCKNITAYGFSTAYGPYDVSELKKVFQIDNSLEDYKIDFRQ